MLLQVRLNFKLGGMLISPGKVLDKMPPALYSILLSLVACTKCVECAHRGQHRA